MPSEATWGWYITDDRFLASSVWNAYRWLSCCVSTALGVSFPLYNVCIPVEMNSYFNCLMSWGTQWQQEEKFLSHCLCRKLGFCALENRIPL